MRVALRLVGRFAEPPAGDWDQSPLPGAALAVTINHAQSERGKPDRRFRLWLDRLRRLRLRKANELVEANVSRHRFDGLSLLCQQRFADDRNRHDRDSRLVLSPIDALQAIS